MKFQEFFRKELGLLQGIKAVIKLKESLNPGFAKVVQFPLHFESKLNKLAIHKQILEGELEPADQSD